MLTGETEDTLKPGRRVDAVALRVFASEVVCSVRARARAPRPPRRSLHLFKLPRPGVRRATLRICQLLDMSLLRTHRVALCAQEQLHASGMTADRPRLVSGLARAQQAARLTAYGMGIGIWLGSGLTGLRRQVPELEGVRATIAVEDLSSSGGGVADARERVQPGATLAARCAPRPLARAVPRRAAQRARTRPAPRVTRETASACSWQLRS
jgi:hypothetical protein